MAQKKNTTKAKTEVANEKVIAPTKKAEVATVLKKKTEMATIPEKKTEMVKVADKPIKEVKTVPNAKKPEIKQEAAEIVIEKSETKLEKKEEKAEIKVEKSVEKKEEILVETALQKNILFVCSEAYPFSGSGGLGEVMGSLPRAINKLDTGYKASIILPLYESFPASERNKLEFVCHLNVPLAWRNQYCGLFKIDYKGTIYYFVDNEYYFKRPNLYGYYDDGERFAFLSRAVVELIPYLGFKPDILHCQDWQTALTPIYYKLFYQYREGYGGIKTIFTIHNIEYQGKYAKNIIEDVFGIPSREYTSLEHRGCINLMKGAIDYSDAISTVSPTYAKEIMDPFYSHGLENILLKNSFKLRGILNGVDVDSYNPKTNAALFANYSENDLSGKAKNKAELQKMLSLPVSPTTPIIAIISRLVSHKGLDLIRFAMNDILKKDVQVVLLGKGDPDYENYFSHIQKMYDKKFSAIIAFNKDLSHKIYAASDIFLMPSKSEPCGLSQMMAARYGTIPIVRATGGLKDSIIDCFNGDWGNGYTFNNYDSADMMNSLERAIGLYRDYPQKWASLVYRAMTSDFTWDNSAKEYLKFYHEFF